MLFVQNLFMRAAPDCWEGSAMRKRCAIEKLHDRQSLMEPKVPEKSRRGRAANSPGCAALSLGCAALAVAAGILCTAAHAAELAPHDMILPDRLTWGINASSAAHLQAVGTERWLNEQLHPASDTVLPDGVRSQIEAMPDVHKFPFNIAVAFEAQAKSANQVAADFCRSSPGRAWAGLALRGSAHFLNVPPG
jgi:hypothetical protein